MGRVRRGAMPSMSGRRVGGNEESEERGVGKERMICMI